MAGDPVRSPRSLTEAQRLCEAFALADAEIAAIEHTRDQTIAKANAAADAVAAPLVARRAAIRAKLEPWWAENAAVLTQGKRKSAELGGVVLGTRTGKAKLVLAGAEAAIVEQLRKIRGGLGLVRVTHELDKTAAMAALDGKDRDRLLALGLSRQDGTESFYIERTWQAGTAGKIGQAAGR